jgi:hypothetical protein
MGNRYVKAFSTPNPAAASPPPHIVLFSRHNQRLSISPIQVASITSFSDYSILNYLCPEWLIDHQNLMANHQKILCPEWLIDVVARQRHCSPATLRSALDGNHMDGQLPKQWRMTTQTLYFTKQDPTINTHSPACFYFSPIFASPRAGFSANQTFNVSVAFNSPINKLHTTVQNTQKT